MLGFPVRNCLFLHGLNSAPRLFFELHLYVGDSFVRSATCGQRPRNPWPTPRFVGASKVRKEKVEGGDKTMSMVDDFVQRT